MTDNRVVRQKQPPTETQYHNALVAGLSRAAMNVGRGALADKSHRTTRALEKLFSGEVQDTSGKGLLDFTLADPSALDEVLSLYGVTIHSKVSNAANDMELAAGLGHGLSELIDRLRDGKRCHLDTLALAELFRHVIPQLQAIVDEADSIRGAA